MRKAAELKAAQRKEEVYTTLLSSLAHKEAGEEDVMQTSRFVSTIESIADASVGTYSKEVIEEEKTAWDIEQQRSAYRQATRQHITSFKDQQKATTATLMSTVLPKVKNGTRLSKEIFSEDEALEASNANSADVVPLNKKNNITIIDAQDRNPKLPPTPSKSNVQTVDTIVSGFWETNPNAVEEVQLAARLPIVHNQIRTIVEHLITSRPTIQGPPELVGPIRQWFEVDMELQTGHERGLDRFVSDIAKQILYYGSATVIKQRTLSGVVDAYEEPIRGKTTAPVWGYIVPDMATMEVFIDNYGRPRKWRQMPHLYTTKTGKEYKASDVFVAKLPTQNS